jgi:hypothetical protein
MRPRASEGNVEMIAAGRGWIARTTVCGHPVAKRIRLASELAALGLFIGKLRFGVRHVLHESPY